MNTEKYTHLAVNKFTNLIVNGWNYADVEPSELKEFKNDYFIVDLKDYGFNPKVYKIVTSKFAEKNGINQWSNTGVYPLEEENKMKDEGINFSEKAYEEHPDWFYEDVRETIKRNNRNNDMRRTIKLSESEMKRKIDMIVSETLKRALNEVMSPEDKWVADEEADEDMRYEMGELNKAFQKANDTYQATSSDGNFKTGDNVIVHTRKGDIEGVITDFDVNFMTYKETADVEYNENGRTRTLLGCPLDKIEKIG